MLKSILKALKLNESTISMILGALVIIVVGALIFNYFRGVTPPAEEELEEGEIRLVEEKGKIVPEGLPRTHTVAEGEHLWAIAERYFGSGYNWVDISQENGLVNPDVLLVGQELTIPKAEVRQPTIATAAIFGPTIEGDSYTVAKGDHLWGIAVRAYGDGFRWVEIAQANGLEDPNVIHPGNVLSIPR